MVIESNISHVPTMAIGESRLYFSTDWYLTPNGISEVNKRFDKAWRKQKLEATLEWQEHDQLFLIICLRNEDRIYKMFHSVLRELINEETGEFEEVEVEYDSDDIYDADYDVPKWVKSKFIQRPRAWKGESPHTKEPTSADESLSLSELSEPPYVHHIFYAERTDNFELLIKPLGENEDTRLLKTTLLDPLQISGQLNYRNLKKSQTIKCCVYNQVRGLYTVMKAQKSSLPAIQKQPHTSAEWISIMYRNKGTESDNPMRFFNIEEKQEEVNIETVLNLKAKTSIQTETKPADPVKSIQEWAENVTTSPIYDMTFSSWADRDLLTGKDHFNIDLSTSIPPNAAECSRTMSDDLPTKEHAAYNRDTDKRSLHEHLPRRSLSTAQGIFGPKILRQDSLSYRRLDFDHPPSPPGSPPGSSAVSLFRRPKPTNPEFDDDPESITRFFNPPGVATTLLDDTISSSELHFPTLQPSSAEFKEKVQTNDEVSSREYRILSDKKAPKGNASSRRLPEFEKSSTPSRKQPLKAATLPAHDPSPDFLKEFENSFYTMMQKANLFPGMIRLKVEFGRIIIRKMPVGIISEEGRINAQDSYVVQRILSQPKTSFDPREGPQVSFTNILTTVGTDAQFLANMKNRVGKRIWELDPISPYKILYEFHCTDTIPNGCTPFIIEICAETFETSVRTESRLGDLYIHGTMRNWDFRISAVGYDSRIKNDEGKKRQEFVNTLTKSLYIPKDSQEPILLFTTALPTRFQVEVLRVHRTKVYNHVSSSPNDMSRPVKSQLNITEVLEMDINFKPAPSNNLLIYRCEHTSFAGPGEQTRWFEVNITSPMVDENFQADKDFTLSGTPLWTPVNLSKMGIARHLCIVSCEMLKAMDGVGSQNDNGTAEREAAEEKRVPRKNKPEKKVYFW